MDEELFFKNVDVFPHKKKDSVFQNENDQSSRHYSLVSVLKNNILIFLLNKEIIMNKEKRRQNKNELKSECSR